MLAIIRYLAQVCWWFSSALMKLLLSSISPFSLSGPLHPGHLELSKFLCIEEFLANLLISLETCSSVSGDELGVLFSWSCAEDVSRHETFSLTTAPNITWL